MVWSAMGCLYGEEGGEEDHIRLFEDFSGKIVNGSKHFGFTWTPSEGNNETLVFENGKILFSNGTVLLITAQVVVFLKMIQ
jgi:hypothetical protein